LLKNIELYYIISTIILQSIVRGGKMNRIKELRLQKGLRQKDLAQMLNTSQQTIGRYESEEIGLDVLTIGRLCDVFECTADYLLCRSNTPEPAISDEDAELLQAFHAAPPSVAAAIQTLLQPYRKENEANQAI